MITIVSSPLSPCTRRFTRTCHLVHHGSGEEQAMQEELRCNESWEKGQRDCGPHTPWLQCLLSTWISPISFLFLCCEIPSHHAGHAALDASLDTVGSLGCKSTLLGHIQLFIHQYAQFWRKLKAIQKNSYLPQYSNFGISLEFITALV